MEIKILKEENKREYNDFILSNGGSFLQSFEWGEFQKEFGREVKRYFVKDGSDVLVAAEVFKYDLPMKKSYEYIPYGPVLRKELPIDKANEAYKLLFDEIKKSAIKEGVIFLKVEQDISPLNLKNIGLKKSAKDVQARETLIFNTERGEEEMLKGMKQKTRYNIRLAEKRGVNIFEVTDEKSAFKMFYKILEETSSRNGFRLHPKSYYEKMVGMFFSEKSASRNVISDVLTEAQPSELGVSAQKKEYSETSNLINKIYFAEYNGKVIASALVGFFGKRATFLHGASSDEYKNVMAPYLLHWHIIKKAHEMNLSEYDFWGIVTDRTDKKKKKQWEGFSRFKIGFGGEVVEYDGAYDLVFSKFWYFLYNLIRRFR